LGSRTATDHFVKLGAPCFDAGPLFANGWFSFASGTYVFRSHLWLAQEPLAVGDWSETHKVFDTPEVAQFAALSEDINPIHLDAGAALPS
jgi:hypothetical protein